MTERSVVKVFEFDSATAAQVGDPFRVDGRPFTMQVVGPTTATGRAGCDLSSDKYAWASVTAALGDGALRNVSESAEWMRPTLAADTAATRTYKVVLTLRKEY